MLPALLTFRMVYKRLVYQYRRACRGVRASEPRLQKVRGSLVSFDPDAHEPQRSNTLHQPSARLGALLGLKVMTGERDDLQPRPDDNGASSLEIRRKFHPDRRLTLGLTCCRGDLVVCA